MEQKNTFFSWLCDLLSDHTRSLSGEFENYEKYIKQYKKEIKKQIEDEKIALLIEELNNIEEDVFLDTYIKWEQTGFLESEESLYKRIVLVLLYERITGVLLFLKSPKEYLEKSDLETIIYPIIRRVCTENVDCLKNLIKNDFLIVKLLLYVIEHTEKNIGKITKEKDGKEIDVQAECCALTAKNILNGKAKTQ